MASWLPVSAGQGESHLDELVHVLKACVVPAVHTLWMMNDIGIWNNILTLPTLSPASTNPGQVVEASVLLLA